MANLITIAEPQSKAAEAYQSLRTSLEFSSLERPVRTILLAAVDDSVDKSAPIANLAIVMAQAGERILLIDGNLRQPRQHRASLGWPTQRASLSGSKVAASRLCRRPASMGCTY